MIRQAPPIARIRAFAGWIVRTPWPVFTLGMLQADIIGALFVLGFLRFGLPPKDRVVLQELPQANLALFAAVLLLAFTFGSLISLKLLLPVFRWQRSDDDGLGDTDPVATEFARTRALKMPFYRSLISGINWLLGGAIFIVAIWPVAKHSARTRRNSPDERRSWA